MPRCTCGVRGVTFSFQSFQPSHWMKRPDLLVPVRARLAAGSGIRRIAREFGVAHSTILRLSDRLRRLGLLPTPPR